MNRSDIKAAYNKITTTSLIAGMGMCLIGLFILDSFMYLAYAIGIMVGQGIIVYTQLRLHKVDNTASTEFDSRYKPLVDDIKKHRDRANELINKGITCYRSGMVIEGDQYMMEANKAERTVNLMVKRANAMLQNRYSR